jgi:hypothetical protein
MGVMSSPIAASASVVVLAIVAIASVALLVLIVLAPWKRVRDEPPLDKDMEARVLLGRPNPEQATGEMPVTRIDDAADHEPDADYSELRDLDDSV